MSTAQAALIAAVARLRVAGVEDPARDGRLLLAHALGVDPARLPLVIRDPLDPAAAQVFEAAVTRRAARQPVSQILGYRWFHGRKFIVTPDTLDPRPETEVLVAEALREPFARLLDIGTGTGAILLSALAETPAARGTGTDISPAALAVAQQNAAALGLAGRAEFTLTRWLDGVPGTFDLIVSNPPYIALDEMADLAPEVRDHEPHLALTDGADGLTAYRAICAAAPQALSPGGRILFETGPTQGAQVAGLLAAQGLADIRILPDFDGRDRVVFGRKPA